MNENRDSYISNNFEQLLEAFAEIDLEAILGDIPDQGYIYLSQPLMDAAREAKSSLPHYTSLSLLHEVCAVSLNLDTPHNAFDDHFTEIEIDFFVEIARLVSNPFLRGRLADRVWCCPKYRGEEYAQIAIDSYTSIPITADAWYSGGETCWRRAISLCMLIGEDSSENRLAQIECSILTAFEETTTERGLFGNILINVLDENSLAKNHSVAIAAKLESLAQTFDTEENFHASGNQYNKAASWFNRSGMDENAVDMMVGEAKAFEKEAMAKISSPNPSHMAAVVPLKNALKVLRDTPNKHRERHNIENKIRELETLISDYGQMALDEMATIRSPGIDISDCISQARDHVSDKPTFEAFVRFANLHNVNVDDLRISAKKTLSSFPFRRLFPTIGFESDGRVGGTTPGYYASAPDEDNEAVVHDEMFRYHYIPLVSVVVNGMIVPALWVLNREHCLRESDFVELVRRSTIVPNDRKALWGKALFKGFNFDFETSIHLMAPQIEYMVRWHLKSNGVRTTSTDFRSGGRETENGLCKLMELAEVEPAFGRNWTYEIRTLFCGPTGCNIRNEVAHGMLSDYQSFSGKFVYSWWFALKMVVNSSPAVTNVTENEEP